MSLLSVWFIVRVLVDQRCVLSFGWQPFRCDHRASTCSIAVCPDAMQNNYEIRFWPNYNYNYY